MSRHQEVFSIVIMPRLPICKLRHACTNKITNQQTFSLSLSFRGKASSRQV